MLLLETATVLFLKALFVLRFLVERSSLFLVSHIHLSSFNVAVVEQLATSLHRPTLVIHQLVLILGFSLFKISSSDFF